MFRYEELSTLRKLILFKRLIASGIKVVSGAIASFITKRVENAISLKVALEPIQDGSGTPSPTNIRPISGHTEVDTHRTGKNLFDVQTMLPLTNQGYIGNDGTVVASPSGTWLYTDYIPVGGNTFVLSNVGGNSPCIALYDVNKNLLVAKSYNTGGADILANIDISAQTDASFVRFSVYADANKNIIQIEVGATATAYEPYNGNTYTTDLGRTVYGGTLEQVGGQLTDEMGYIASYNGEAIGEPWLSDRDEYVAGTTPSIGAEVVYTLATPQTYQLTPTEVQLLLGTNNVWSDGGNVEVTYKG